MTEKNENERMRDDAQEMANQMGEVDTSAEWTKTLIP